jgi:hypothetical protein
MKNLFIGGLVLLLLSACGESAPAATAPNPQREIPFAESIEFAEMHVAGNRVAFSMRRTGQADLNDALFTLGRGGQLAVEGAHMKGLVFSPECMDSKCEALRMVVGPEHSLCLDQKDCLDVAVLELHVFRDAHCSISATSNRNGEAANSYFAASEVTLVENRSTGTRAMKVVVATRERSTPNEAESFFAESTLGKPGLLHYATNYFYRKVDGTLVRNFGSEGSVPLLGPASWDFPGRSLMVSGQSKDRRNLASVWCNYGGRF